MFGKIFDSMYDGTLVADWRALVTFQQMIVLCDSDGVVDITPHAIAARTGIPIEHIEAGLRVLENPDPYSRTPDNEGKRIELLDDHRPWGWKIVNHSKYKYLLSREDKKTKDRARIAEKRARVAKKQELEATKNAGVARCRKVSQGVADVAHTDTDTDTDTENTTTTEAEENKTAPPARKITDKTATPAKQDAEKSKHEFLTLVAGSFNEHLPDHTPAKIPQPLAFNRIGRIQEIIDEEPIFSDIAGWDWDFSGINDLEFYNGRHPDKNFKCNIDYFLKPETFNQLYEKVDAMGDAS